MLTQPKKQNSAIPVPTLAAEATSDPVLLIDGWDCLMASDPGVSKNLSVGSFKWIVRGCHLETPRLKWFKHELIII